MGGALHLRRVHDHIVRGAVRGVGAAEGDVGLPSEVVNARDAITPRGLGTSRSLRSGVEVGLARRNNGSLGLHVLLPLPVGFLAGLDALSEGRGLRCGDGGSGGPSLRRLDLVQKTTHLLLLLGPRRALLGDCVENTRVSRVTDDCTASGEGATPIIAARQFVARNLARVNLHAQRQLLRGEGAQVRQATVNVHRLHRDLGATGDDALLGLAVVVNEGDRSTDAQDPGRIATVDDRLGVVPKLVRSLGVLEVAGRLVVQDVGRAHHVNDSLDRHKPAIGLPCEHSLNVLLRHATTGREVANHDQGHCLCPLPLHLR